MKKVVSVLLCVTVLLCFPFCARAYSASALALVEQSSRAVVDSVNSDRKLPMASTTKIMTALVVVESIPLDAVVSVPSAACGIEGSSIYLVAGEKLSVSDLLYGLLLESGNDAAVALAIIVGGSVEAFVTMMNDRAQSLGLKNTHFTNPAGLPDEEHYTTAYELALITAAALENDIFAKIVATKTAKISGRVLTNHNKLLSMYKYCIGVKTGFTKKAGRCLVSAARKNGVTLICVTLNAPDDWNDHISAFEYGFSKTEYRCVAKKGDITVMLSTPDGQRVIAQNPEDIYAVVLDGTDLSYKVFADRFVYAPKALGQSVGKVSYYSSGNVVVSSALCLAQPVDVRTEKVEKQFFLNKLFNYIKGFFK